MNRDWIVTHALKSGFAPGFGDGCINKLHEFALFVASAEREACAKLCDKRSAGWDQVKISRDDVEACMNAAAKNEARALAAAMRERSQA